MVYGYTGLTFRLIYSFIALWRVRQEQKLTTRYHYGSGTLHPENFLVVPAFVARCLYVCKDDRDPSGNR